MQISFDFIPSHPLSMLLFWLKAFACRRYLSNELPFVQLDNYTII